MADHLATDPPDAAVTLDWLSGGCLTLGAGLGSDRFGGELSATGEQLDDRRRGQMPDEALRWLAEFEPETVSLDQVRGVLRGGPPVP